LSDDFITFYERIRETWPEGSPFQQMVAGQLPVPGDLYDALTSEQGMEVTQAAVGFTSDLFSFFSRLAIVVILSVYWTAERIHFERLILFLVPVEWRPRTRDVWRAVEDSVGAYIRSEGLQSVLAGLLLGLGTWGIGLPYPLLLALFGALLRPIPWLGPLSATILAFILGWTVGLKRGMIAAVFTLVVFFLIKAWLEPRLFHRRRYSSVLMALVVLILFNVSGLMGAILAPLVGIAVQIFFLHFLKQKTWREEVQASGQFDELRERLEGVQDRIADFDAPPSPELTSLANRLEELLDQAAVFITEEKDGGASTMTTHESM
jgi:predicted PurR-regulated permease PerM